MYTLVGGPNLAIRLIDTFKLIVHGQMSLDTNCQQGHKSELLRLVDSLVSSWKSHVSN